MDSVEQHCLHRHSLSPYYLESATDYDSVVHETLSWLQMEGLTVNDIGALYKLLLWQHHRARVQLTTTTAVNLSHVFDPFSMDVCPFDDCEFVAPCVLVKVLDDNARILFCLSGLSEHLACAHSLVRCSGPANLGIDVDLLLSILSSNELKCIKLSTPSTEPHTIFPCKLQTKNANFIEVTCVVSDIGVSFLTAEKSLTMTFANMLFFSVASLHTTPENNKSLVNIINLTEAMEADDEFWTDVFFRLPAPQLVLKYDTVAFSRMKYRSVIVDGCDVDYFLKIIRERMLHCVQTFICNTPITIDV